MQSNRGLLLLFLPIRLCSLFLKFNPDLLVIFIHSLITTIVTLNRVKITSNTILYRTEQKSWIQLLSISFWKLHYLVMVKSRSHHCPLLVTETHLKPIEEFLRVSCKITLMSTFGVWSFHPVVNSATVFCMHIVRLTKCLITFWRKCPNLSVACLYLTIKWKL